MSAARRGICALGLVLTLLAGCTSPDSLNFLFLQSGAKGNDRVIVASVDSVSQSVQASLSELGLAAQVSRKGDTVYVASKTATGAKFTFVLTREKGKDGAEQTRVRIDWESGKDEQMAFQLLTQLEARATH